MKIIYKLKQVLLKHLQIRHGFALLFILIYSAGIQAATEEAIFAGGCFWCMESDFQDIQGVRSVVSGYTGGHVKNPSYKQVTRGNTGHYEAVKIRYNPDVITYQQLLDIFWVNIDPFDQRGQFCDKGQSYLAAIFPANDEQRSLAETSKQQRQKRFADNTIITPIIDASRFYKAEDYHQDYYKKNPKRYKFYRWNCGRDARLKAVWGE